MIAHIENEASLTYFTGQNRPPKILSGREYAFSSHQLSLAAHGMLDIFSYNFFWRRVLQYNE